MSARQLMANIWRAILRSTAAVLWQPRVTPMVVAEAPAAAVGPGEAATTEPFRWYHPITHHARPMLVDRPNVWRDQLGPRTYDRLRFYRWLFEQGYLSDFDDAGVF